ncbi:DUF6493 family protein [Mucilaginibacter psychrotolerans]|uniref:HEAT repeat domain-containing protein n=1 Tax=Mucilaginibacter psychrotolerans TaxID=1524096 RepID=A0A4Y8SEP3_9SPHI|nr:DUF6493 family protein [Mucilaginibacter psychrotolerans]TFF37100.1 hypothetical protein E2R66_13540 [Mucilaginibacter psychrotolerans]
MTITQDFTNLLENDKEAELIPFLQKLDKAQKKELVPALKRLFKVYSAFSQEAGIGSVRPKWSNAQRNVLGIAGFVCHNQKDFEQSNWGVINKETLDTILPWYCPAWFSDFINSYANQDFTPYFLNYDWYMELVEQNYVIETPALIAKILPNYIIESKLREHKYVPENLLKREITLKEHIWYIFEHESGVNWSYRYINLPEKSKDGLWIDTFKKYTDENKIDRKRLLKVSLKASNNNFNQTLSGWFIELFIKLEPTKAEVKELQEALFQALNSPHSKVVNTSAKYLKDLTDEKEFLVDAYLDYAVALLTSESKTVVAGALMTLDKLAKKHPDQREQICVIACQAFIHQDNSLQLRAAKLIQKYGHTQVDTLKETIQTYYDALFSEARDILIGFAIAFVNENSLTEDALPDSEASIIEIRMPENFDDFVFLASQSFDQNETYHFDLLPAAVLKFQHKMTADNILKLMPAFQRAYKIITSDWNSTMGYLDNMLAKFFISYGQLLVNFTPFAAEPIRQMQKTFVKLEDDKKANWSGYQTRLGGIKPWDVYTHSLGYKPHKHILLNAFFMLERKINLPLLSTPTHEPCWVSAVALIERLSLYQKANVMPGEMDLQVAIARCLPNHPEEALKLADEKLTGEYRAFMGFVLGEDNHAKDSYKCKTAWLMAGVAKSSPNIDAEWSSLTGLSQPYLNGEFGWESKVEDYFRKEYNYNLKEYVNIPDKQKIIRVNFGDKQKKTSTFKAVLNKLLPGQKEIEPSVYDYTELKFEYISAEHNDIKRLLYLMPRQPDILLAHIINKGFHYVDFMGENDKRLVIYTLETLLTLNYRYGTMSHLFVATCMISSDKTVRTYAAELWIKGVAEGLLDSNAIGRIIGKHERIELAPLKRFTDLIIANMFQISKKHNSALEGLLCHCVEQMGDTPINGCKKLLEIYAEVLAINKSKIALEHVIALLNIWESTESLKKIIQKLKNAG